MSQAAGTPDAYKGYRDPVRALMQRFEVTVWSDVEVDSTRGPFRGLVLPRSETADAEPEGAAA